MPTTGRPAIAQQFIAQGPVRPAEPTPDLAGLGVIWHLAIVPDGQRRRGVALLMIAATAIAEDLPLFTTNPGDYAGLEKLIRIAPVTRPPLPHGKKPDPR